MSSSNIEWTDCTWNPVVGCTRVSPACDHCYAVSMSHRLEAMSDAKAAAGERRGRLGWYVGLTVLNNKGDRHFNGRVECVPEALGDPLGWRKPRMVFTASMSDIFHERVPFEFLDRIFAVMALTPQHTYQVLTKRPERMAEYLNDNRYELIGHEAAVISGNPAIFRRMGAGLRVPAVVYGREWETEPMRWPLPNVWLGTTVEDQSRADERIPHLIRCPAAVRFVSCEPLLGGVDLLRVKSGALCPQPDHPIDVLRGGTWRYADQGHPLGFVNHSDLQDTGLVNWVIAGGETASAEKARPTDDAWLRSLRDQCAAAGVPFFLKQRTERGRKVPLERWPDDLRVREWPAAAREATP